jgi:hypothetical protein
MLAVRNRQMQMNTFVAGGAPLEEQSPWIFGSIHLRHHSLPTTTEHRHT